MSFSIGKEIQIKRSVVENMYTPVLSRVHVLQYSVLENTVLVLARVHVQNGELMLM